MVKLKNGEVEPAPLVAVLRVSLSSLLRGEKGLNGGLALYELGKLAKDPTHKLFDPRQFDLLKRLHLLEGTFEAPQMHGSTRNIVACMVEFKGEMPYLVDPRAGA